MSEKLFVRSDVGAGSPIVLLHGMFADGSQWDTIVELLSKNYRVIVVDLLGHGRSPRPEKAKYTDKEHVASLHNTLVSLGATKSITVVGYSMGGAVALAYSSMHPSRVAQLYLISTPFYLEPDQMIPNKYAGSIIFTKLTEWLFSKVEQATTTERSDKIIEFGNSSDIFHKMIGANDNELDSYIIRMNLKNLVRKFNFVWHLKRVQAPVTFYAGKKDIFVVQSQLDALRQFKPYMDIQRLDIIKIDHMLVQNLPRKIAQLLQKNSQNTLNIGADVGSGNILVMLHGIESSHVYWEPLIKPLSENYRVVAVDLLGFGESPKPLNISYSLDDQVEWLKQTLDNHGIKKFEFCAHSLGAIVAVAFAAKYPKQVKKMTLLAPVFVPSRQRSNNQIIRRLNFTDKISDGSYLYSHTAKALGYARMSKYLPSLRTLKNSIRSQNALSMAKKAQEIPTNILFGSRDGLIDKVFLAGVAKQFRQSKVEELKGEGHNFALFNPRVVLRAVDDNKKYIQEPKSAKLIPPSFAKQLVNLAFPVLLLKSALYIFAGVLSFSRFAPWVITLGLGVFVMVVGYSYIRGAFSLRNENLSYVGYVLLGIVGIIAGLLLPRHSDFALRVSALIICALVLLAGLARLLVAYMWIRPGKIKYGLIVGGAIMTIIGSLALAGGVVSTKLIVYSIAVALMARGLQFGCYAVTALFFAYVRGFNR